MDNLAVGLRDLEFDRRFYFGRRNVQEAPIHHRVRVGVPRIKQDFARVVFYLFGDPANSFFPSDRPNGTGFLVARRSEKRSWTWHVYAVSNSHVVNETPRIRLNTKAGGSRIIPIPHEEWICSDTEDLAVADVTDYLDLNYDTLVWNDEISWIDESNFVKKPEKSALKMGIGDDTFMMGLFEDHRGGSRNAPVGRFGNVAALPNASNPVRLSVVDRFERPAYLNDMRSRTGFSGSPVWVWRSGTNMESLPWDSNEKEGFVLTDTFVKFLGVHRGQIWERVDIKDCPSNPSLVGSEIAIASAMTAVIPCWEVSSLLDLPQLNEKRMQRDLRPDRINLEARIKDGLRSRQISPTLPDGRI